MPLFWIRRLRFIDNSVVDISKKVGYSMDFYDSEINLVLPFLRFVLDASCLASRRYGARKRL